MQEVTHTWRLALAIALAAATPAVAAVILGEVEARSALGEALDARIPFTVPEGTSADASCFAILRQAGDGPQGLGEGLLTIERRRGERALRVRTLAPVLEPAVLLRIRAACPGQEGSTTREYALLLDPRAGSQLAPLTAPLATSVAAAALLNAHNGDSLASTAAKVYPAAGEARRRYLALLREANPQLAAQGDDAPIAEGTVVALPDLRSIPRRPAAARPAPRAAAAAPAEAPSSTPELPAPKPAPAPKRPPAPKSEAATAPAKASAPRPAPVREPASAPRAEKRAVAPRPQLPAGPSFVLKLSSAEVDLTPSRKIDDRMRAQLRERLLILDADDQVAAMLSMRNSLKQLEARVAEMQLKLDSMPASLAARAAAPAPASAGAQPTKPATVVEPPKVEPPKAEPPKAELPKAEPPKVEAPKVEPPKVEAPKVEPPPPVAAKVEPPKEEPPKVEAPKIEPPVVSSEPTPPKAEPAPTPAAPIAAPPSTRPAVRMPSADAGLPTWLWGVVALLVLVVLLIGAWLWRRGHPPDQEWPDEEETRALEDAGQEEQPDADGEFPVHAEPSMALDEQPIEIAAEVRPELASDASLATRLPGNSGELRRRYIEERFPEIQNRTIVLDDAASVVKGARLFYEDGALSKAIELLQFAIEDKPEDVRPWLALFEIFRIERVTGEFAEVATRFRDHHGKSEYWPKVQYVGREIDPGNALYKEKPLNTLETIGPREARRLAAGLATVGPVSNFDPIAENWLNAPMDFENEVLANELRMKLMSEASLTEQDLIPNPMPALRNVEMFNVV